VGEKIKGVQKKKGKKMVDKKNIPGDQRKPCRVTNPVWENRNKEKEK